MNKQIMDLLMAGCQVNFSLADDGSVNCDILNYPTKEGQGFGEHPDTALSLAELDREKEGYADKT